MRKIRFVRDMGILGTEDELREYEDDISDNDIERELQEWILSRIMGRWEEIEQTDI